MNPLKNIEMTSGQYDEMVPIKTEIEFKDFNEEQDDEKNSAVERNNEDVDFMDFKAEEIKSEDSMDITCDNIKSEIVEKIPEREGDITEKNVCIKFGNDNSNSFNSLRREDTTQIKTENDCVSFDEVFHRKEIKYEQCHEKISESEEYDGCGGESDFIDHTYAYSKHEDQKEEKCIAFDLKTDVDFTDSSTIQCKAEQINSELDSDINNRDSRTNFVEKRPVICEMSCGDKAFNCNICMKTFTSPRNLKIHQRIHKGEKPYRCEVCSKAFTQWGHLKGHEKTHTGERPFHCKFCFKAFPKSSDVKRHERIHTGEKPFRCKICSKSFTNSSDEKYHERIHTGERPFLCKFCSKTFTQSGSLKVHERIHTGREPFHCKICSKNFTIYRDLKRHEKIHTGEKPFLCNICSRAFARSDSLKKHERIHTAGK